MARKPAPPPRPRALAYPVKAIAAQKTAARREPVRRRRPASSTTMPPLFLAIARFTFAHDFDLDYIRSVASKAYAAAARLSSAALTIKDSVALHQQAGADIRSHDGAYLAARKHLIELYRSSNVPRTTDEEAADELLADVMTGTETGAFLFGLAVAFVMLRGTEGAR